ncbi:hypothetical protein B194_0445 [Serratia plymuthica A30]|nr:hypothetical protein B194_0445 [Serratia plymuthica A30]
MAAGKRTIAPGRSFRTRQKASAGADSCIFKSSRSERQSARDRLPLTSPVKQQRKSGEVLPEHRMGVYWGRIGIHTGNNLR